MKSNKGKKATLTPEYKLLGTMETMDLYDAVQKLTDRGVRHLVIDMVHVQLMNGSGIGFLAHTFTTFQRFGGTVRLKNLSKRLRECLDITHLSECFRLDQMKNSKLALNKRNRSTLCMYRFQDQDFRPRTLPCR